MRALDKDPELLPAALNYWVEHQQLVNDARELRSQHTTFLKESGIRLFTKSLRPESASLLAAHPLSFIEIQTTAERSANVATTETLSDIGVPKRTAMNWVEENWKCLEEMEGEWILVANDQLLIHSPNYSDVVRLFKEKRTPGALIHYIPRANEADFLF